MKAVWDMFLSFSGYSFCKPHSASYALVSFKSAYLKVHYPAEFMAAVISNGGGYYSTLAYISEARRMGITVLGPDLNESDWNYRGAGKTIRMGLQQLQNIRQDTVQGILDERSRNGPFTSLDEFLRRVKLTPADGFRPGKERRPGFPGGSSSSVCGAGFPACRTPGRLESLPHNQPSKQVFNFFTGAHHQPPRISCQRPRAKSQPSKS